MIAELPPIGPAAVTMGVFDGVHRGHRAILGRTRDLAAKAGAASVALAFDPHPDEIIRPGTHVARLCPPDVVRRRIAEAGITHAIPVTFDEDVKNLPAEEFLAALRPSMELRWLVMSPESAFGHDRGGTPERMREYGYRAGFEVVTVEPMTDNGALISSSRLRAAVAAGDLAAARRLGSPAYLRGVVVVGDRRGRDLGYPTANLRFDYVPAMPPRGIYTGRAAVEERGVGPGHPALVSIGTRPTFHDQGELLVEVHLLDFDGDLYGAALELELVDRLRDELRFDDASTLVAQMRRDELDARQRLGPG
jgi:riboflavin kinase/FMN adenylyltransferase